MIHIIIFTDGFHHFEQSIAEFTKRLGKKIRLRILKPSKSKTPQRIITDETQKLIDFLPSRKGYNIVLAPRGESFSTPRFADFLEKTHMDHNDINFFIGGSYGLRYDLLLPYTQKFLSLSRFTFPHACAYMLLLEQIYRCESLKQGSKYHHE